MYNVRNEVKSDKPQPQEIPAATIAKKSLRLFIRECRKKKNVRNSIKTYRYPRTVEAAQDPFKNASGKNKMFYVIACNLFPDSKIIQPSDSESEEEEDDTRECCFPSRLQYNSYPGPGHAGMTNTLIRKRRCPRRIAYGKAGEIDHSWRTESRRRCQQRRRDIGGKSSGRKTIINGQNILDAINSVVAKGSVVDCEQRKRNNKCLEESSVEDKN